MPGPYGLLTTGFNRKRTDEVLSDMQAATQAALGADLNVDPETSALGAFLGVLAEPVGELWELAEAIYAATYPDSASGNSLEDAMSLTGHAPTPGAPSTVTLTLGAVAGPSVLVPAGSLVAHATTGVRFATLADCTIPGAGTNTAAAECIEDGPNSAAIGTLTVIATPVSGWSTATNLAAAVVGNLPETDEAARARRNESLVRALGGPDAAVVLVVSRVQGVEAVSIRSNRTDVTDANGLPPHSQEVVVIGGADADVAAAIYRAAAAGIATHGTEAVNVTDAQGFAQSIKFSRGTDVPIYLVVNVVAGTGWLGATDGVQGVKDALVAYFATLEPGDDVLNWRLLSSLASQPGIDGLSIFQGIAPAPMSSANTLLAPLELATLDAANITVNVT